MTKQRDKIQTNTNTTKKHKQIRKQTEMTRNKHKKTNTNNTFLCNERKGPSEDIHEVRQPIGMGRPQELTYVHHSSLVPFKYKPTNTEKQNDTNNSSNKQRKMQINNTQHTHTQHTTHTQTETHTTHYKPE